MSIIDDIKRLERIGSEDSKTTQKIIDAAHDVADLLVELMPNMERLPRQYSVYDKILVKRIEKTDYLINGPKSGRTESLVFAHDIATGLLSEFSSFLAMRGGADEIILEKLIRAQEAIECTTE